MTDYGKLLTLIPPAGISRDQLREQWVKLSGKPATVEEFAKALNTMFEMGLISFTSTPSDKPIPLGFDPVEIDLSWVVLVNPKA